MSGTRVPLNYWLCDACNSPNAINMYPRQCPCGHYRSTCCYEAGSIMPNFSSYRAANYSSHARGGSSDAHGEGLVSMPRPPTPPDSWKCPSCGASNSGLTPDFCPVCDWRA